MSRKEFLIRNLTWGLPVNIGGAAISSVLLLTGHKPKKYGNCIQFDVGENWGGGSLGLFMFTCKSADNDLKAHELGHSIQNCYYGPLMPFLVNIPSSARFWSRKLISRISPDTKLNDYYSAWFEAQASRLGKEYIENTENKHD